MTSKMIDKKVIIHILGFLLIIESAFIFLSLLVSLLYKEADAFGLLYAGGITLVTGALLYFFTKTSRRPINKREGYIIVSIVWIIFSLFFLEKAGKEKTLALCQF